MKYNLVNFCEFDKYAVKSYCAIHGVDENKNLGDITKVEKLPKCDFLTYGFPCQDISIAGLQAGIKQGTRSGLLFEVERLLEQSEYKPKFLLMENVKNLIGKNHKFDFNNWLNKLEELGYKNYWKVLNAKDYGVPQNRERVFCLSIREDIDCGFEFPVSKGETTKSFMEFVDTELTEKEKKMVYLEWNDLEKMKDFDAGYSFGGYIDSSPIYKTITARYGKISGNSGKFFRNHRVSCLTPKECWRLMGLDDEDYYKAEKVCDFKQLYKQAGNSIVVNVLMAIYEKILKFYPNDFIDNIDVITLFSGIGAFEKAFDKI